MARDLIRTLAGQQFVENDAQAVNVARRSDHLAFDLFRACVSRRHQPHDRKRLLRRLPAEFRVEDFGDAKVQELWLAVRRDENVRWFEVAMNNQILMRVMRRRTGGAKELQPLSDRKLAPVAVNVNRLSFDVFEREPGQAVFGRAAVEQTGNVGMVEAGENLSFMAEAANDQISIHSAPDQFDGHKLL